MHDRRLGAGNIEKRGDIHMSRDHPARVGRRIGKAQSFVSAHESGQRRLDVSEFVRVVEALKAGSPVFSLARDWTNRHVFKSYWLEMVAVVPSNLVKLTVNGSLYVWALSLRKLSATASPSTKDVSVSLRQWMPAWIP